MADSPTPCAWAGCYRAARRGDVHCQQHARQHAREARAADDGLVHQPDLFGLPVLPYAGTSGHAGTATSEARAVEADQAGTTADRQARTIDHARHAGHHGITWRELAAATGWHHGTCSGALSVLHKAGQLVRLTDTRERCRVYVTPDHQAGRPADTVRTTAGTRHALAVLESVDQLLAAGQVANARAIIATARRVLGGA